MALRKHKRQNFMCLQLFFPQILNLRGNQAPPLPYLECVPSNQGRGEDRVLDDYTGP